MGDSLTDKQRRVRPAPRDARAELWRDAQTQELTICNGRRTGRNPRDTFSSAGGPAAHSSCYAASGCESGPCIST